MRQTRGDKIEGAHIIACCYIFKNVNAFYKNNLIGTKDVSHFANVACDVHQWCFCSERVYCVCVYMYRVGQKSKLLYCDR